MTTRTAGSDKEQRRARRYAAQLPIEMRDRGDVVIATATDVSRHGLFVSLTTQAPRERHLIQLSLSLPEGKTSVAVRVARVIPSVGFGAEFFALSADAKNAWDQFVSGLSLSGSTTGPAAWSNRPSAEAEQAPVFVVRLRTLESLRNYEENHVRAGGTVLFTPVLPTLGSAVRLAVVHPLTEQEMMLEGTVREVFADKPKRIEIQFPSNLAVEAAFTQFVASGRPPSQKPTPAPLLATAFPGELELDVDIDNDDADTLAEQPVSELPVLVGSLENPARRRRDPFFDISMLPRAAEPVARVNTPVPSSAERIQLRVHCNRGCGEHQLELGRCRGWLGLIADDVVFVSPSQRSLVATPRIIDTQVRQQRLAHHLQTSGAASTVIDIGVLVAAGDLSDEPRHPATGERLVPLEGAHHLRQLAHEHRVPCPWCVEGTLMATPITSQ
jgi:hypothetical protein